MVVKFHELLVVASQATSQMLTKTATQITTAENHLIEINCDHCAKTDEMNFIAGLKAWRHSVCASN